MTISTAYTSAAPLPRRSELRINGAELVADLSGALWWPARATLVVADLHLEKGTSRGRDRLHLPPYDSAETLRRLARTIEVFKPSRVVCLGDSFHDDGAEGRLTPMARSLLAALAEGRDWVWISGNHDPAPPGLGLGRAEAELVDGPLVFRHEARPGAVGEISGHYHPKAAVRVRLGRITGRCFVADDQRLVLPAFGAYAGGLDVTDPAIAGLFEHDFAVRLIGRDRLFTFPRTVLIRGREPSALSV